VSFGSGYFNAGDRNIAAKMQALADAYDGLTVPVWTLGDVAGFTAIGGSSVEATNAALTAPSSTYKAHTAYHITFRALLQAGTTTGNCSLAIRDTNASGTQRMTNYTIIGLTTNNFPFVWDHWVANTSGTDITSRVLCVTFAHSAAGGAHFNAAATLPWVVQCKVAGVDSDYTQAVAL
jgi:hypothetical protein